MRSDGVAAMVSHVRLAILATIVHGPFEVIQQQTSKGQSPANSLAKEAVKEVQGKIRTLSCELDIGQSRTVPENDETLAWLVQHEAGTINWHRTLVDGRTPFHRRTGNQTFANQHINHTRI